MRRYRYGFMITFCISVLLLFFSGVGYAAKEESVVRVGYYEDTDYMKQNESGDYVGYNLEYLMEISKYNGWKYEIVDGGSWENSLAMLEAGEIDLLPAVFHSPEREENFLFPSRPMCNSFVTLNVRSDDTQYFYNDIDSFTGMRVGVIKDSLDADSFEEYCMEHELDVTIIPYAETAPLLQDLERGELDGVAITYLGRNSTFRNVAQFATLPLYIAVAKEREDLLSELNETMDTIRLRNPSFDARLYDKYFSVSDLQKPVFTKEEQAFIQQTESIAAVYDSMWKPLQYTDESTGEFKGVIADLFESFSDSSGLKFHFIPSTDIEYSVSMLEDSAINVLCGITSDYIWNSKNNVNTTQYYLRSPVVMIDGGRDKRTGIIAMQKGYFFADEILADNPQMQARYYTSPEECFDALLSGDADITYMNTYTAEYLFADKRYHSFTSYTLSNYAEEMSIGISSDADPRLFSILDKCILYTSKEQTDALLLKNTMTSPSIAWEDVVRQHPLATIGSMVAIFSVIILLLGVLLALKSKSEKRIETLLYRDGLTNLWNLHKFLLEGQKVIDVALNETYALIYVDIKRFRSINDMMGFSEGDRILCALARILETTTEPDESCARVSADHFMLLLHYTTWEALEKRTYEISDQMKVWINQRGQHYSLSLVCGVYVISDADKKDISVMMDFASCAKRSAVATHKSVAIRYDSQMREEELLQRALIDRLPTALKEEEFLVYYQPKVDMPTGKVVGSEALVRWRYEGKKLLSPNVFIPVFEKTGAIVEIDLYVFEQVCKNLKQWMESGLAPPPVSCNFSRMHFSNPDFPGKLLEIADQYEIPHNYVELEVTESVFVEDIDRVLKHFTMLREWGFPIAIDDFGSGYSSLGLLQQFAVDVIKIDRSLIQEGMKSRNEQMVVRGIVEMIKALNMQVLCEGVETAEQAGMLMDMGCRMAQGFYFAKPMTKSEYEEVMQKEKKFER